MTEIVERLLITILGGAYRDAWRNGNERQRRIATDFYFAALRADDPLSDAVVFCGGQRDS